MYFEGNPPALRTEALSSNPSQLIVYYFANGSSWPAVFGGRPTVMWNPTLTREEVGSTESEFVFTIRSDAKVRVVIQKSGGLLTSDWTDIANLVVSNSPSVFRDALTPAAVEQFYRLQSP